MAAYMNTVNFSDMGNDDNCNLSDSPHEKVEDIVVKEEPECKDDDDCNEGEKNLTCMTCGECFRSVEELFLHIDQHVKFELKEEVETSPPNDNLMVKVEFSDIENDDNSTLSDSLDENGDDIIIKQEPECLLDSTEIEKEQKVRTFPIDEQIHSPLTCLTCEKRFRTTNELYLHIEKHNKLELKEEDDETLPPNEFTNCQVPTNPNPKFTREQLLHEYINVSVELDGKPTYTCKLCPNEVFDRQISIRNHMQIHEKPKLKKQQCHKCDVCDASFTKLSLLESHKRLHTGEKPFICDICGKCFRNSGQLSGHKKIHFEKSVQCPKCDKKFTFNKTLLVHLRTHSKDRSCTCSYCGKLFKTNISLTSHMRVHTDDKPHKCTYCDKSFMERKRLNRHIRIHTGERPYKCSYCDATFTRNENLTYHLRSHTGEKPYECSDCGKCFSKGKALSFHQKTHTDDKPYSCPHCDMRFRQSGTLTTHLLIHTNERPFKCDLCDKSFRQSGVLRRHVTTIHTNNV